MDKIMFTHTLNGEPKTLTIKAVNRSEANIYVQSLMLNGKPYKESIINHQDIFSDNCSLIFIMGNTPNQTIAPH